MNQLVRNTETRSAVYIGGLLSWPSGLLQAAVVHHDIRTVSKGMALYPVRALQRRTESLEVDYGYRHPRRTSRDAEGDRPPGHLDSS